MKSCNKLLQKKMFFFFWVYLIKIYLLFSIFPNFCNNTFVTFALDRISPAFVPKRYIRAPEERPAAAAAAVAGPGDVPIIDMLKLGSIWHAADELKKLAAACEEWGFFQVHIELIYYRKYRGVDASNFLILRSRIILLG